MRGTSRKQREKEQHRREVLEAAEAVFAEKGFYNAAMQEIAHRAEFAVGSLYNIFDSKAAIYRELLQMRARQYRDEVVRDMERCTDPCEKIRAVIRAKLRFFEENQRFFQIFTRATSGEQPGPVLTLSHKGRELYRTYVETVSTVFEEGIKAKVFVNVNPKLLTLAVECVTNAAIAHALHTGGEKLADTTPEVIERILFEGILRERANR